MLTEIKVREVWKAAECVCFDVDSTVVQDEGIDELANYLGVGGQVAQWTKKAMGGGVSFREALQQRLDIIQPSKDQLAQFIDSHPPRLSPGIKDLVTRLQVLNKRVFLVSGGFRDIIAPIAKVLSIPSDDVFANQILFNEDGSYKGFDLTEPTSDSGGKPMVIKQIKARWGLSPTVMVGDGATDMEASPPADAFIGYGGNVIRDKVKAGAPWFVEDFQDLIDELS